MDFWIFDFLVAFSFYLRNFFTYPDFFQFFYPRLCTVSNVFFLKIKVKNKKLLNSKYVIILVEII